jgi:hypothetical protein
MDPTLITACQMFLVPRHLAHASRRGQMEAAGFLDMSVEMLDRVYGHHHPDYLRSAARLIGYRRRETVPISVPVTLPTPGPATQAIEIMSGPGRARTSNQTVMSGPVSPESSNKIDVFRGVRARSFASVHGVSVVYLWSVRHFPKEAGTPSPWPWRTHKVASTVTSNTPRSDGSPQEKDGPKLGSVFSCR